MHSHAEMLFVHAKLPEINRFFSALACLIYLFFTLQIKQSLIPDIWSLSRSWAAPVRRYAEQPQQQQHSSTAALTFDWGYSNCTPSFKHTHAHPRTEACLYTPDVILNTAHIVVRRKQCCRNFRGILYNFFPLSCGQNFVLISSSDLTQAWWEI